MADCSSNFSIDNLPFGIASSPKYPEPQAVTRYGNLVIFLSPLISRYKASPALPLEVLEQPTLNTFAALGQPVHDAVRRAVRELISSSGAPTWACVEDISNVTMHLPVSVGDFTDYSCSEHHNLNAGHAIVGRRGLPPTWGCIPPGYAGRCSSIVVSGTPVRRPRGQFWEDAPGSEDRRVVFGPCRQMDYEVELGAIIGAPLGMGETVSAGEAGRHIFGFVMLNDWSSRDIQAFEMMPLGPLNSKNSATSMSPWVIPYDAVEAYRCPGPVLPKALPPHLYAPDNRALPVDLSCTVTRDGAEQNLTSKMNAKVMSWSFEQLIAHQASAGCGLRPGDLLGIGTVSEDADGHRGCLLEDNIPSLGRTRGFLHDGDTVLITGECVPGVGFGECIGQLLPAVSTIEWTSES